MVYGYVPSKIFRWLAATFGCHSAPETARNAVQCKCKSSTNDRFRVFHFPNPMSNALPNICWDDRLKMQMWLDEIRLTHDTEMCVWCTVCQHTRCVGGGLQISHRILFQCFHQLIVAGHFSGMRLKYKLNFIRYAQFGSALAFGVQIGVVAIRATVVNFTVALRLLGPFGRHHRPRSLQFTAALASAALIRWHRWRCTTHRWRIWCKSIGWCWQLYGRQIWIG